MYGDGNLISFYVSLTPRQREVTFLVSQGLNNREVADRLCIAPSVVAGHLTNIYESLANLDHEIPSGRADRYALIRLFADFFERFPELSRISYTFD
ncbi:MAG: helix-turn-helix transcriptional regulator [Chloroflexi bacterium]|nr:helix-turn-helix transcriptional regulator [Chloroflexota bacterium]